MCYANDDNIPNDASYRASPVLRFRQYKIFSRKYFSLTEDEEITDEETVDDEEESP